jgi:hypothetical protein
MWTWLNYSDNGRMVKSWVVVFVATVLTLFMASGLDVFSISWTDAQAWIAAGIAAVVPLVFNWLNPKDDRYGIKESA